MGTYMKQYIVLALILSSALTLYAQEAKPLTVQESIVLAQQNNPRVLIAQEKLKTAEAQVGQAGQHRVG